MKTFCLIAVMAVAAGLAAHAQSNTNAAPPLLRVTDIYSDSADFDWLGHTATNRGNVRVIATDMKLTCTLLIAGIADLPPSGWHLSRIVAETNVVLDAKDSNGQPIHATGDRAVYVYSVENGVTNDTVTLTGNPQPQVVIPEGTIVADVIVWDRARKIYHWSGNQHFMSNPDYTPAAATNNPTAPKINLPPGADTNYPPGTLDLVPPRSGRGGPGF
jgi:lipopolysaccharide export system protein LptA